jgi:NADP-dependent 3-hydroxy acid dehydrogenase YdfG
MTYSLSGKTALVTGASSGFGEATALMLAEAGCAVALVARRADRLNAIAKQIEAKGGKALVLVADLSVEAEAIQAVRDAEVAFGHLDILVNNAGVMFLEPVATADLARWRQMFELNMLGLIAATQAALPGMRARKSGHIVNISSTAGHFANPNGAAYSATKYGVIAFSDALRREMVADRVRVTVISPGVAATELRDHIGDPNVKTTLNAWADSMRQLTSEDVADAILYAVTRPEHVGINEILMRSVDQER